MITYVYAFRQGSRDYPRGICGAYETYESAKEQADRMREIGHEIGRIRKTTLEEVEQARASIRSGCLPAGW